MKRFALSLASSLLLATFATGCAKSVMVERPTDNVADQAVTVMWADEIHGVARTGDWILTRSYTALADGIGVMTSGEDLSHASIYDASTGNIIEAIDTGVREISLRQLLQRNHYAIVVRPSNMTTAEREHAVARARSKIGAKYDVPGLVGIDDPDAYYCSELVYWASQTAARTGERERVITPAELMKYGEIVYWSGKRDDPQVMGTARERVARR